MSQRPQHKHALQSICNIRNTDYMGTQPHFRFCKNPAGRRFKRYSSSLQDGNRTDKLQGWDDPHQQPPQKCTNMLYNLSVKLQNYECLQKKKDDEVVLDEIKENYKSIMEKARLFARPTEVFSKYRQQINLYKETEYSEIIQSVNQKEIDSEYRPGSNQITTARPKLEIAPVSIRSKQSQILRPSRDPILLEKHKSLKSIRDCPRATSLLARGKANKLQKFKSLLAQQQKLLKVDLLAKQNAISQQKHLPGKLKPRKFDLSLVQRKQRLTNLQKRSNAKAQQPPTSQFEDTKLFILR